MNIIQTFVAELQEYFETNSDIKQEFEQAYLDGNYFVMKLILSEYIKEYVVSGEII